MFNEHLSNIAETLHGTLKESIVCPAQLLQFNDFSIWLTPTTISEIENTIRHLDNETWY